MIGITPFRFESSLLRGLQGYWNLNESTGNALDSTSNANHLANVGSTLNQAGKIGTCWQFDGNNNLVYKDNVTVLSPTDALSISFWFKAVNSATYMGLVANMGFSPNRGYWINIENTIVRFVICGTLTLAYIDTTSLAKTGNWIHIVGTWSPSDGIKIYYNGGSEGSASGDSVPAIVYPASRSFCFADRMYADIPLTGSIDEVGIWNRALTAAEVLELYNLGGGVTYPFRRASTLPVGVVSYWKLDEASGNAIDSCGYANMTVTGAEQGTTGKIDKAYTFVAANSDGLASAQNLLSLRLSVCTIAAWINPVDNNANRAIYGSSDNGIELTVSATERLIFVASWWNDIAFSDVDKIVTHGVWNHVVVTYNSSGDYAFYINGQTAGSGNAPYTFTYPGNTQGFIGRCGGGNYFNGDIDEVGVWNRALSAAEVTELYNNGAGRQYPFN